MLDTLNEEYVLTARAKGLGEPVVIGKHTLKNSAIPIVTLAGLDTGAEQPAPERQEQVPVLRRLVPAAGTRQAQARGDVRLRHVAEVDGRGAPSAHGASPSRRAALSW